MSTNTKTSSVRMLLVGLMSLGLVTFGVACGDDDDGPNGGDDTGITDTGSPDTGTPDSGPDDAGDTNGGSGDTAPVYVIHSAADPAASTVDVWVNDSRAIDDFEFGQGLPFAELPAGEEITIAVTGPDAEDPTDPLVSTTTTLDSESQYIAVATGVANPDNFADNPDGEDIAVDLKVTAGAKMQAESEDQDEFIAFHAATDAPTVDLRLNRAQEPQLEGLTYGMFSGSYSPLPAQVNVANVERNSDGAVAGAFQTPNLEGGQAWIIVASGFMSPGDNQGGPGFALRAFPAMDSDEPIEGSVLSQAARVQIVHAAPEDAVNPVDIWENNGGMKLVDDLPFEGATGFVTLPSDTELNVGVAPMGSESAEETVASQNVTFGAGSTNVVVASGIAVPANTGNFENVDNPNFALSAGEAKEMGDADGGEVELNAFHGSTDAFDPVDVRAAGNPVIDDLAFQSFSGIQQLNAGATNVEVTDGDGNSAEPPLNFTLPLGNFDGGYLTVVASGFVTAEGDPPSERTFKLLAVQPDGTVTPVTPTGSGG